ncbi:hypothetical protein EWM60_18570 [Candidatus Erwinia dacicola]|nr:hypothetical protein [Candidatus Erwinia dacicola]
MFSHWVTCGVGKVEYHLPIRWSVSVCHYKERQKASLERRSETHRALHAVISNEQKEQLEALASKDGVTH